ncbi:MAG: protein translocase subunit SecD, partial [Deltaproteobacteria bacterium]|nr:protein translocase subunit SecD [Deltaproteobacteria bacterium]
MSRGWYFRLLITLLVLGGGAYLLYPSYYFYFAATPEQRESNVKFCEALPRWATCTKFNLGLDLQGGVHLVMGVLVDKAVEQRADR